MQTQNHKHFVYDYMGATAYAHLSYNGKHLHQLN